MTLVRGLLALLLASLASSCASVRLLADPARGYELAGPRTLALGFDRLSVELLDDRAAPGSPALALPGSEGESAAVVLVPLWAYNGSGEPWAIDLEDFDITPIGEPDQQLPPQQSRGPARTPLALVTPGGRASLRLPLRFPPSVVTEPHGRFRLRCMVVRDGEPVTILERDLVVDEQRPLRQTVYVVGIAAIVLAVGVAL